ncbi:MAG: integrase core domain-containing protein [Peptococcaceae bacterium]
MTEYELRKLAIKRYLAGEKPTDIYKTLSRSRNWFYKWLNRYSEHGFVGLKDQSRQPKNCPNKTNQEIEKTIINIRKSLMANDTKTNFYAPIGAESILWELHKLGIPEKEIPSIATINRIINRNNLVNSTKPNTSRHNIPYPAPEAKGPNDVHQLDPVGPRFLKGVNGVEKFFSLHLVDYYSKMVAMRQYGDTRNLSIIDFLTKAVWTRLGVPKILQVDNMLSIKGSNKFPRSPGLVIRLCLLFGIEVLFIPIKEPQRNGVVESFNNTFNKKFFRSQNFDHLDHLKQESLFFEDFYCTKRPHSKLRINTHGSKIPYEVHMKSNPNLLSNTFDLEVFRVKSKYQIPLHEGKISFIRWIDKSCAIEIFSEKFQVSTKLKYQYVKATIHTKENVLQVTHENEVVQEIPYYLMD